MGWRLGRLGGAVLLALHLGGCRTPEDAPPPARSPASVDPAGAIPLALPSGRSTGSGEAGLLRVHVYDVGQGLSVLVDLPGGRHLLVDTGDAPDRTGCGPTCDLRHRALMMKLARDLRGRPIDLLWLTHPHSDHIGGAPDVLRTFRVGALVDNGRDPEKTEVRRVHEAARQRGVPVFTVDPEHPSAADAFARGDDEGASTLAPVLPPAWPPSCLRDDEENDCSLVLRVAFGSSSVLFTGDAEREEEARLEPEPSTLLQVGHHGSHTSSTAGFLARVRPTYAVISAGGRGEGLNREYCHPREDAVKRLSRALGGPRAGPLQAFDGGHHHDCKRDGDDDAAWHPEETSARLWATERDGDVVLRTNGDGVFTREPSPD